MITHEVQPGPVLAAPTELRGDPFTTAGGVRGSVYRRAGDAGVRPGRTAIAIGQFDGVHRGHQQLLSRVRRAAPAHAAVGAVTFDRHPMALLAPDREPPALTSLAEKVRLLLACRLDLVVVLRLEPTLLQTGPVEFVDDLLVSTLNAAVVAVGPNFRFGRGAVGGPELLQELGPTCGFSVVVPDLERDGDAVVSSTNIRRAIAEGDVASAARLLGARPTDVSIAREEESR